LGTKYQNLEIRRSEEAQIAGIKATLASPEAMSGIGNKGKLQEELRKRTEKLERITPPDLTGDQTIKVKRRHDSLRDAMVEGKPGMVPAMPSRREMEQAPSGAVDKHLNFEMFWKRHNLDPEGRIVPVNTRAGQQNLLHELKDHMRTLGKAQEEWSPNVANLDMFRPEVANVSLAESILPRSYGGTSPQYKANYDKSFPDHTPTPVERKLRASSKNPCAGTKSNGQPCKASAKKGHTLCVFHAEKFEPVLDAPILAPPAETPIGG